MEIAGIIVMALLTGGASYALGRAAGGAWIAFFFLVMAGIGGVLWYGIETATGDWGGLAEALLFYLVWAPVLVCGTIGGCIGWSFRWANHKARVEADPDSLTH